MPTNELDPQDVPIPAYEALRAALLAGEESGIYEGDIFEEMKQIILNEQADFQLDKLLNYQK